MNTESKNTEEVILEAAEEEFLEKGFSSARTVSIAEKAGVTHAMLNYYFRSKEQLFEKILNEKVEILLDSVTQAFASPELPVVERIEKAMKIHFQFLAANPKLPMFLLGEMKSRPDLIQIILSHISTLRPVLDGLQKDLDKSSREGKTATIDLNTLVVDFLSLNLAPFLILNFQKVLNIDKDSFLKERLNENMKVIESRLQI